MLPVLQQALRDVGHASERDACRVATSHLALEGAPDVAIDGTERRRQRPTKAAQPQEHYSGKKKTHTDKNLLLVNEHTRKGGLSRANRGREKTRQESGRCRSDCLSDQCHARQGHGLSGL